MSNQPNTSMPRKKIRVYTALLTQESGAPVAEILQNTLGFEPYWQQDGAGIYYCLNDPSTDPVTQKAGVINGGSNNKDKQVIAFNDVNYLCKIETYNFGSLADYVLYDTLIEIRVYE